MKTYRVNISWDSDAQTWIATSDDILGLCAESETMESLIEIVKSLAPELLIANGVITNEPGDIPLNVIAERHELARVVA
jgi:predicted RNase H-like HicB family nuclease